MIAQTPSISVQYITPDGRLTTAGYKLFLAMMQGAGAAAWGGISGSIGDQSDLASALSGKQATLVSGTNIKTVNGASILGAGDVAVSGLPDSFETVSANLDASDAVLAYSGADLDTITYANGVVKTFAYGPDGLASITLSGTMPGGIDLVKTFTYTTGDLTGISYS